MAKGVVKGSFNVHGLARVHVETRFKAKLEQVMHHVAEFEEPAEDGNTPDVVIQDYADAPVLTYQIVIADHYLYGDGTLNIPSDKICYDLLSAPIRVYCDRLVLPLSLLIHLALLRKGHALIHAAAVEFEGRHYLFPALGGVGKTTLVAGVVFAGGKMYGDDLNIVNENEVLSYPQDFSVYPYHLPLLRLNERSIVRDFARTAMLDRITDVLESYDSRPARLVRMVLNSLKITCVNVPPRRIFGGQCFAKRGVVDEIYYLLRTAMGPRDLVIKRIEPRMLAQICTDILFHEWHESLKYLYVYGALCPFSPDEIHGGTMAIFERLFASRPCYVVEIPVSMTNVEYQEKLLMYLSKRGQPVDT
jgi:hypothetical protein